MSKSLLILVTDQSDLVQKVKAFWEDHDVQVQVYSRQQWKEGLEQSVFRQQLGAQMPTLSSGVSPLVPGQNMTPNTVTPMFVQQAPSAFSMSVANNNVQRMEHLEAQAIEKAILQFRGNLTEAAKALGLGRATLYRKVKQYQIDVAQARHKKAA